LSLLYYVKIILYSTMANVFDLTSLLCNSSVTHGAVKIQVPLIRWLLILREWPLLSFVLQLFCLLLEYPSQCKNIKLAVPSSAN